MLNKCDAAVPVNSERSFGIVMTIIFAIIACWPILSGGQIRIWSLVISAVLLILALFWPRTLRIANKLWFKLGIALGTLITPIVMALLFFTVIVPTGLIMRVFKKDLISQRLDKSVDSYWIHRKTPMGSMKNQF